MNILFVHQNFPGQFKFLAPAMVARGHVVKALCLRKDVTSPWQGIELISYPVQRNSTRGIHPWLIDFETKVIRAEAAMQAAQRLAEQGFVPDIILAHPGWGESLFLKRVWPTSRLALYAEFFYGEGADTQFDPEFEPLASVSEACRLELKNLNHELQFAKADAAISPTEWQASTFPAAIRSRITVIHEGIDTTRLCPDPHVKWVLPTGRVLTRSDTVITFVSRHLEPYRGYHRFIRLLPELLRQHPQAHVLVVGGDGVSYGAPPPAGTTWKQHFWQEVAAQVDVDRVHFLGQLPYDMFKTVLQISTAHVYLTYPFVLSWSLLEAMSCGCAIVASATPPLQEVINHESNGLLVDFFDHDGWLIALGRVLTTPSLREALGRSARATAVSCYDMQSQCLPRQIAWLEAL